MIVIEIIEMIVIGVIAIFSVGTAVYKPLSWITIWIREGCKRNLWCIVTEDDFYQGVIIIWSIALITFGFLIPRNHALKIIIIKCGPTPKILI